MEDASPSPFDGQYFQQSIACRNTHQISRHILSDFPTLVDSLLCIKTAAAKSNVESGELYAERGARIVSACARLRDRITKDVFFVDPFQGGGGFGINGNVNEAIRAHDAERNSVALEIKDINKSQSSADVCGTALRLGLHHECNLLRTRIDDFVTLLTRFCHRCGQLKTLARTCWQDALSIAMADRFFGIINGFQMCQTDLHEKARALLSIPLGSTVVGTGHGAHPVYRQRVIFHLGNICNLSLQTCKHPITSAQNFPDIASLASVIKIVAENIIRFGLDLRILNSGSQGGLFEIILPKVMPSSSFFPHKFNPTIVETAIQGAVYAHSMAASLSMYRIFPEIDLNVFEWSAGINLYLGIEMLSASLARLNEHALKEMAPNFERCQQLSSFAHTFS